ncbi:hypothetical protein VTH06DRAFT_7863 [Thermothelomyces fergusii]
MASILGIGSQLVESLTPGRFIAALLLLTLSAVIVDFTWKPLYSNTLPRVGPGGSFLGTLKSWAYFPTRYQSWVAEGHEKYSKQGRAFVVPSGPYRPQEIVIPRSQTAWMLEQPDHVLSTKDAHRDTLHKEYQFFGLDDGFPVRTVHNHLARNLAGLIPAVQEEVHAAIDATFGKDVENWTSLNVWDAWLEIIPRVTNRILVGAPLCRNQAFLDGQVGFANDVIRNGFLLDMVPLVFQPLVGPFIALTNWWHWRKSYFYARPVIEQRLHDLERQESGDDPAYGDWKAPEDMLTWLIRQAKEEGLTSKLDPEMLSKRLLPLEFAAIHTTVLTGFNLTLDLLSSDPSLRYIDAIREETARVFAEENGTWTKQGLARLHRTDSAIKESMRFSHFARSLTYRKVIAPEGVTNPVEGWHASYGAFLMLDMVGAHRDPAVYAEPDRYDAWRFSRQREAYDAKSAEEKKGDDEEAMRIKRLGMVTTSAEFLAFSHGRHACPGRFSLRTNSR